MLKKNFVGLAIVLTLLISSVSFADSSSSDALSKFKDIGQGEQSSSSQVPLLDTTSLGTITQLPSVADIKTELGDNPQDQLATLKNTAESSNDAGDYLKLAVAYELTNDNKSAIESLQKAITIAPSEKELYAELVKLYKVSSPGKITVFANGDKISFSDANNSTDPVVMNGRTLVPIRKITEKLGAKVDWDASTSTAKINLLGTTVELSPGSADAKVNGISVPPLDVPAKSINGRIYVPLRFISEQFNKTVSFVPGDNGTAIIFIVDNK